MEREATCRDFKVSFFQKLFFLSSYAGWRERKSLLSSCKPCFVEKLRQMCCRLVYTCKQLTIFSSKRVFAESLFSRTGSPLLHDRACIALSPVPLSQDMTISISNQETAL